MTLPNAWIVQRRGALRPFRLICFCYAGGNAASFLPWQDGLHPDIGVCAIQLPGRGARFHEAPRTGLAELVDEIVTALGVQAVPFAFFGHSMGALLAYEVARELARRRLPLPRHLFASGCDAPRHRGAPGRYHLLDDASLIDQLKVYNGTPPEVLAYKELMELLLPTIRADFTLAETYRYRDGPALSMPLTVFAGSSDEIDGPEQVHGWQDETSGPFEVKWFDGDHFFIHARQREVLAAIEASLADLLPRGERVPA